MAKNYFFSAAIVALSLLVMTGCDDDTFRWITGSNITFGARSKSTELTRAAYAGTSGQTTESTTKYERIDWESGDKIRIQCQQASEPIDKYADYVTTAGTASGRYSTATISLASSNPIGLRWGSGTHEFYAVYPSPETSGTVTTDAAATTFTGSILASQPYKTLSSTDGNYVATPNLKQFMMMAAKTSIAEGSYNTEKSFSEKFGENTVLLDFYPVTTAIEFTIMNKTGNKLDVKSVALESASYNLNGAFQVSFGTTETGTEIKYYEPVVGTSGSYTSANKSVSISFPTTGDDIVSLADGKTLQFTLFLNPTNSVDDLVFKITDLDGKIRSAALKNGDSKITFTKSHKIYAKGIFIPEDALWAISYSPELLSWTDVAKGDIDLKDKYTFKFVPDYTSSSFDPTDHSVSYYNTTDSETDEITIFSNKLDEDDIAVGDDISWTIKSVKVGGGTPTDVNAKSWTQDGLIEVKNVDGTLKLTIPSRTALQPGTHSYWTTGDTEDGWSPADWSSKTASSPIDLSMFDFKSDASTASMNTANCYIVRHAGTYKIPLVYGNGVKDGDANPAAYEGVNATYCLYPFKNHLDNGITDPFIENNSGVNVDDEGAVVVWQDEAVVLKDLCITGDKQTSGNYDASNVRYLQFTVDAETICQNNALIAVTDEEGKIVWSWHIWVTNDPALLGNALTMVNRSSKTYYLFPLLSLGWIDDYRYLGRPDVEIELEQKYGKTTSITIKQPEVIGVSNGTYYQFGRKDPFPRFNTDDTELAENPTEFEFKENVAGSRILDISKCVTLGTSVQQPYIFNADYQGWLKADDSNYAYYRNLWAGKYASSSGYVDNDNSTMLKTIYDPSPVGYKVPAPKAFSNLSKTGNNLSGGDHTNWNYNGNGTDVTTYNGYRFYLAGTSGDTFLFPAVGWRAYYGGVLSVGVQGYYSCSTRQEDGGYKVYYIETTGSTYNLYIDSATKTSDGFNIRPVKE